MKILITASGFEDVSRILEDGAAIDVFEKEPPDMNNPIFKLDNIVATPHIAWCTENSIKRVNTIIAKEVSKILEGKKPNLRYIANPYVFDE